MRNSKGQFVDGEQGKQYRFTSESSKGNQHAKGNPPNKTSFDGSQVMEKHPSWKGGIQKFKRDGLQILYAPNKRMSLAKYRWQKAYGELPKGYIIRHIDGDIENNEIENLAAITRAENLLLNSNR